MSKYGEHVDFNTYNRHFNRLVAKVCLFLMRIIRFFSNKASSFFRLCVAETHFNGECVLKHKEIWAIGTKETPWSGVSP